MDKLPAHGKETSLDFCLDEPESDLLPQETKQFDGRQLPIAPDEYESIMKQVETDKDRLLQEAATVLGKKNAHLWERLKELYENNLHCFRTQLLGEGPIRGIPNVTTPLIPGAENATFRHKTRVYNAEQMEFLSSLCQRFIEAGMIIQCEPQKTSSPVLVVKKPNGKGFRMVIDLRMANKLVEELAAPAIHLDMVRNCLSGAKYFGSFDLTDGFWQVQMDEIGRRLYSFQTHEGNYQMMRIPQGARNSAAIFQTVMNHVCGKFLYRQGTGCIPYLDDMLLYARTPEEMINLHAYILEQFNKHNVKVKLEKSFLVSRELPWIGLTVSEQGLAQQQSRIDALLKLPEPETGADLATFLGALNWMKSWLGVNYHKIVQPLLDVKQKASELVQSMKTTALKKVNLAKANLWSSEMTSNWRQCLDMIAHETTILAHPDLARCDLHIFSDASDTGWGGFCTQTPKEQASLAIELRDHEALGFCSGTFKKNQLSWSTFDQEAWGLVATVEYFSPFLSNGKQKFTIHTDHKNLIYIFCVDKFTDKRQTRDRVTRWSLMLQRYNFAIHHIQGSLNLFADILSRWKAHETTSVAEYSPCIAVIECLAVDATARKIPRALKELQSFLAPGPALAPVSTEKRLRNPPILTGDEYVDPIEAIAAATEHNAENDAEHDAETDAEHNAENDTEHDAETDAEHDAENDTEHNAEPANNTATDAVQETDDKLVDSCINQPWTWDFVRSQHHLLSQPAFIFPDTAAISQIQDQFLLRTDLLGGKGLAEAKASREDQMLKNDIAIKYDERQSLWLTKNGKIWIPQRAQHLQICISVLAHAGLSGHLGHEATVANVKSRFEWRTIAEDIKRFVSNCLHCLGARLGKKIPRPLASTVHGLFPNHVVRMDFLAMPYKEDDQQAYRSILVIKDDHTQYTWLVPAKNETAAVVAKALLDWSAKSKMPIYLAIDQGSHFVNRLIESLKDHTGLVELLPSIASNKQTHGGAENMNRLVRRMFRSLCSERRISTTDWPELVPMVNHVLNHRASPLLDNIAPVELFTGQFRDEVFGTYLATRNQKLEIQNAGISRSFLQDLTELRIMLNNLHRKAIVSAEKIRESSRKVANETRKDFKGFEVGDFVLRGIPEGSSVDKRRSALQPRWIGPYEIVYPKSKKVYICKDLLTGVLYELHSDYLHLYADQDFVATGQVKQQLAFDSVGRVPQRITDFKMVNGSALVQIKWKGIKEDTEVPVWHPISLAVNLWPFQKVLGQLSQLKANDEADKFVKDILSMEESPRM